MKCYLRAATALVEGRDARVSAEVFAAPVKGREQAAASANPAVFKNTPSSVDPSSQIIEVEQLLSDKSVAGAALLKTPLGMAVRTEVQGIDADGARLAVNLNAKMESGLLTAGGDGKWLEALTATKPSDATTKLASVSQTSAAAGVEARLAAPQLSQYQTNGVRTANLPQGLQAAVGQPAWGQAVGERVLMMAAKNLQAAEIQLDPPELGQLQVRIVMNQDQASVTFVSPQQSVREALDESVQRLRDMFEDEGIELANVDVSDQSQSGLTDAEQEGGGNTR